MLVCPNGSRCHATNCRGDVKLALEKGLAERRLIDHLKEVGAPFIVLGPAPVNECELSTRDELPHSRHDKGILLVPPPLEKGLLGPHEAPLWVQQQRVHHAVQDDSHRCILDRFVCAAVALVHVLQPAGVGVRVGHEVHDRRVDGLARRSYVSRLHLGHFQGLCPRVDGNMTIT